LRCCDNLDGVTEAPQIQSLVVLEPAQVPAARTSAAAHGVEVEQIPRRGIEPLTTVTLLLIGAGAAVGSVLQILEQRKGGQVVDLRPGAPKAFYRTPDVVFGTVVIVAVDGRVTVEVREPAGMFGRVIAVLPELVSGGGGDAEQIGRAITEAFGADVTVETHELPPRCPMSERPDE
jgi:hypothetical protein